MLVVLGTLQISTQQMWFAFHLVRRYSQFPPETVDSFLQIQVQVADHDAKQCQHKLMCARLDLPFYHGLRWTADQLEHMD